MAEPSEAMIGVEEDGEVNSMKMMWRRWCGEEEEEDDDDDDDDADADDDDDDDGWWMMIGTKPRFAQCFAHTDTHTLIVCSDVLVFNKVFH